MFNLFKKKRKIKITLTVLILLLGSFIVSPFIEIVKGTAIPNIELIGEYKSSKQSYLIIENSYGRMILENYGTDFMYTYEAGTFSCSSIENDDSWEMIVLGSGNLINKFNNEYMFKVDNDE